LCASLTEDIATGPVGSRERAEASEPLESSRAESLASARIGPDDDEQLLLSSRRPSRHQVMVVIVLAVLLLVAFVATLPYRSTSLPQVTAFIPIVNTLLLLADALTAILLFGQAAVLRSRAFVALGCGYLFTALIIVPHALTFPGAFSPTGLLGAGVSTTIWLYAFWHIGLPLAVIAYAYLKSSDRQRRVGFESIRTMTVACVLGSILLAVALTLLATVGESWLPTMAVNTLQWLPGVSTASWVLIVLLALAMLAVARGERSVLNLWLLLALFAWMLEHVLILTTSTRYSGGWYTGRIAGLLSGLFVLIMLVSETNKLYARLVLSVLARRRERASRLLTVNAVAGSIAHEMKQPLAAISTNAQAGALILRQPTTDRAMLEEILTAIAKDCGHASQVLDSMRVMLGNRHVEKTKLDINELLQETTTMISAELLAQQINLRLMPDAQLPLVSADRVQMQHVFLNLFINAIEAMAGVTDRNRELIVGTSRSGEEVLIDVEDSGSGIDADAKEKIFEPFFSTKPNGTGMGLSLCRSIVELHGGRLDVSLRQPAGTCFTVRLPLEGAPK
jgi:signal transduction histidine kinase